MLQEPRSESPAPAKAIPWKRLIHVAWILGLAIAGGVAYSVRIAGSSSHPTHAASTDPKILARVGDALITESDLLAAWAKKPPFSNTDASQHAAVVLEDLIRRELYFAEATRTRFTEREDVRAAWKRWVTSRFREELESALPASQSVEDAAIEAYFQDHAAQFTAPERRRLAIIRIGPSPVSREGKPEELEPRIARVRELAVSQAAAARDFGDLAAIHSSHLSSRRNGGDVGWLNRAQAARTWPAAVVEAAFLLAAPGDISPIIPTDEGWFLLKLVERQEGQLASLDSVRERIRRELGQSRKAEAETALLDELRSRHRVEIHTERLSAMEDPRATHPPESFHAQRPPSLPAP